MEKAEAEQGWGQKKETSGVLLTNREIAELLGKSVRTVETRANNDAWTTVYVRGKGKGGKIGKHPLHTLPGDIQNLWLKKNRAAILYNNDAVTSRNETLYNNKDTKLPVPPDGIDNKDTKSIQEGESAAGTLPAVRPPSSPPYNNGSEIVSLRDIIPSLALYEAGSWHALTESARDKAFGLLAIVNKVRTILATTPRKTKTKALADYAASVGHHAHSLRRYVGKADKALKKAEKAGKDTIMAQVEALAPGYGRTKHRVKAYDQNAAIYALSIYCTEQMRTAHDVYEETVAKARANNWQVGTYQTLLNYLKRLDKATLTLARQGKRKFEADCLLKILRNYDEIPPNFMWCGDHHIFDVFVKLPDGQGGWNYKRPWVTAWLDMRSRSFMGWCISFSPNSRTIGMALAHAISPKNDPDFLQCGLPSSVYIDNGKDYRAKYLNGEEVAIGQIDYPAIIEKFAALGIDPFYIDLEFDPEQRAWVKKHGDKTIEIKGVRVGGVYARLGIGQRYATAYHPWAKPIERAFRNVVQSFSRSLPGWCGSGHEQRPGKLAFELKSGRQLLTIEEFCNRFYSWVVYDYHQASHRGHGMDGGSPNQVFASLMPAPQTCEPALLDFALLKKDAVKMHNWGFNLDGRQFELDVQTNLQGAGILNSLIGQWVTVFHDYDYKQVRVYRDGTWKCNARPLNRASFVTPNDPAMTDKLKLQTYQKRASAGTIGVVRSHPSIRPEPDEAAALLALSREVQVPIALPLPEEAGEAAVQTDSAGDIDIQSRGENEQNCPLEEAAQVCPYDELFCLTLMDRYREQILPKLAGGWELTPEQQAKKEEFEATEMYQASQTLYETEFEYLKDLARRQSI